MELQQISMLNEKRYIGMLEAVLFAAGESVSQNELAEATKLDTDTIVSILKKMQIQYKEDERGIRLLCVNDTWQLSTKPEHYGVINDILQLRQANALSRAALETLSIIAYRQPVTRIEIEALRGVSSSSSVQSLLDRGLIEEAGRKDAPGRPFLYKTTDQFLKSVHLSRLDELPAFESFRNIDDELLEEAIF